MSVVGARPNFVKLAPVHKAITSFADHTIIHTGQHYDFQLSEIFFKEFHLPQPNCNLEVGSGSHSYQLSEMIKRLEDILLKTSPDLVIVYGDTNSTLAGALTSDRMGIEVAHVESGLRSFDVRMLEESNRILTDHISDYLFAPTHTAAANLRSENVYGKIVRTGDLSVETVQEGMVLGKNSQVLENLNLEPNSYILFTMHRAENTNSIDSMVSVISAIEQLEETKIVFPIHPRTTRSLKESNLFTRLQKCKNLKIIEPRGYIDFIYLLKNALKLVTDSGGAQKEAYLLHVPCITIRKNTEWVETVKEAWNILTDTNTKEIVAAVKNWMPHVRGKSVFGDGKASRRIADYIRNL